MILVLRQQNGQKESQVFCWIRSIEDLSLSDWFIHRFLNRFDQFKWRFINTFVIHSDSFIELWLILTDLWSFLTVSFQWIHYVSLFDQFVIRVFLYDSLYMWICSLIHFLSLFNEFLKSSSLNLFDQFIIGFVNPFDRFSRRFVKLCEWFIKRSMSLWGFVSLLGWFKIRFVNLFDRFMEKSVFLADSL